VFTKAFKKINNESCGDDRKLIVFETNMNAIHMENLNTLLDDNKRLHLANGEVIKLHPSVRFVFLANDCSLASPATVSRLGCVYLQSEEEFDPLASFNDSVVSNLKSLGSEDYMAHKKVMMALAMINAMHYSVARDESFDFKQTTNFAKNYLKFSADMAGFKYMIQDFLVLSVPAKL